MNPHLAPAITWLRGLGLKRQHRAARRRRCGDCSLCCDVRGVVALDKPPGQACSHLSEGRCGIYADRPEECRSYYCAWRLGFLREGDRPDRTGIVPDAQVGFGFESPGSNFGWTVRAGPDADLAVAADIIERLAAELPRHIGFIPHGLPGRARITAMLPGSPEFYDLLAELRSGQAGGSS